MTWQPCAEPVVSDVIRWTEPLWAAPDKKRGKPNAAGEQRITAEVVAVRDYFELRVREVEVLSARGGAQVRVKAGDVIRRKESSIAQGDCRKLVE